MKVIYVSSLCSKKTYTKLFGDMKHAPGMQAQKYNRLMAEGLAKNEGVEVTVISSAPVTRENYGSGKFSCAADKENNIEYNYVSFSLLPVFKHISIIRNTYKKCLKMFKENSKISGEKAAVVCDVLSLSASYGALRAAKKCNAESVGLITDLPEYLGISENKLFKKIYDKVIDMCKSFVLLTEQMNVKINPTGKPYRVIEGQADINMSEEENTLDKKFNKKVCIYAGGIEVEYGLKILAEGFAAANIPESELWIYGNGSYTDELKEFCKKNPSVIYKGVVPNEEVVEAEQKASLLINPRPSSGEFTKYSFPSKNLEYMASGTPVLTTKLPGMPKEYYDHIYIIEEETADGISACLKDILSKDGTELFTKGASAKEFVLKYKNNKTQAGKVLELLS
ncbi:MAG: glycosyltransferase [Clostridia bacterium]|nr:glycosyltransferase [Clostridia bacterium]